jgi:CSLREA domain-containing protein
MAAWMILTAGQTNAAVWTVTKTADTNDTVCNADCSLREAIFASAASGDEIRFASPLFDSPQVINLLSTSVLINKSLTITGKGAHLLTIRRSPSAMLNFRIFDIQTPAGGAINLSGMTISEGNSNPGGVSVSGAGSVTIANCVITGNTSLGAGGISVSGVNLTTNLINSTVSNNTSTGTSGQTAAGITSHSTTLNIINSTISGNSVTGGGTATGGAIRNSGGAAVNITNSTITNNSSNGLSEMNAGGIANFSGTVTTRNSIIAGNVGTVPDVYGDIDGLYISAGYNLIGKNDGAAVNFPAGNPNANNDIVGTISSPIDARLDPLGMYGGTTPTHRLQTSPVLSPAIDNGSNLGGLTTDQRELLRPFDNPLIPNSSGANADGSDIGAFEAQAVVSVSGRVFNASGSGVYKAFVFITNANGETRMTLTNPFGYYRFYDVSTGETYTFQVQHKRYSFTPQAVLVMQEINDLNFTALP